MIVILHKSKFFKTKKETPHKTSITGTKKKIICVFEPTERFRRNPTTTILTIRDCPRFILSGNISERCVSPFLERSVNPKGNLARKIFFDMTEGK